MSSPSKQPTQQQQQKKGGWGSLLSGAVAGLESRLDTILADDGDASAKQRASEDAARQTRAKAKLAPPAAQVKEATSNRSSREASRTRQNDRLAERLAKATAAKPPSRVATPVVDDGASDVPRASGEEERPHDDAANATVLDMDMDTAGEAEAKNEADEDTKEGQEGSTLSSSAILVTSASSRPSVDSSRPSMDIPRSSDISSRPSTDLPNGTSHKSAAELETEMTQMREDYAQAEKQRQEEMHAYLEKIDALQAKLSYLASSTVAAAKEANAATSSTTSEEAKLAEKDERIALLMEEGEKLSKNELRHLQTIKKLRSKVTEDEKTTTETKKKLERAESVEQALKQRLRRAEAAERQANEKTKQISTIEKQVEELKEDRESAAELVKNLTIQLKEAKEKARDAEKEAREKASEVDKGRIAALENELEDAQIEKKLAEDRAQAEVRKMKEEGESTKQRFGVREVELKNEISGLESRVEALRSRAEEVSADGGGGTSGGESNIKLLRQVETLQSQYSLAKENWETIESSLNTRLANLEKERDESQRRESDARKKAREIGSRASRAEEEVERLEEKSRSLEQELEAQREAVKSLEERLKQNDSALADVKADFDKQRKTWEVDLQQRLEDERTKWQRGASNGLPSARTPPLRNDSFPASHNSRKTSGNDIHPMLRSRPGTSSSHRLTTQDLGVLQTDQRQSSRRSSANPSTATASASSAHNVFPLSGTRNSSYPHEGLPTPGFSRQSTLSLDESNTPPISAGIPPTPSIEIDDNEAFDPDAETPTAGLHSPERTINDLVSVTSTAPASGPSVQLVERMSALVRRLESEKAGFKDEIARLTSQRDSSRDEVVNLMREVEEKRNMESQVKELSALRSRYDASLEMLGEREEEVEELKQDVSELKRLYRELVEEKVGPGSQGAKTG